jgi:CHAD domain
MGRKHKARSKSKSKSESKSKKKAKRHPAEPDVLTGPHLARTLTGLESALRSDDASGARAARVAVRRLRSQLRLGSERLDADWVWLVRRELRWCEQAVGDLADIDALGCWIGRQELDRSDEPARRDLVEEINRERVRAHRRLVALLESSRYRRMLRDLARPLGPTNHLGRQLRRDWRSLKGLVAFSGAQQRRSDVPSLVRGVDRVRFGAELDQGGRRWSVVLGDLAGVLAAIEEMSLAQGWLRQTALVPACSWVLVAGQLVERARVSEQSLWAEWQARWVRASDKELRGWLKR